MTDKKTAATAKSATKKAAVATKQPVTAIPAAPKVEVNLVFHPFRSDRTMVFAEERSCEENRRTQQTQGENNFIVGEDVDQSDEKDEQSRRKEEAQIDQISHRLYSSSRRWNL